MAEHDEAFDGEEIRMLSRRAYFRVRTRLALRTREVRGSEADLLRLEVLDKKPTPETQLDLSVRLWLERIERKLDEIRAHLEPGVERPLGAGDERELEISGSGLSWTGDPAHPDGAWVRVELALRTPALRVIVALARAVHTQVNAEGQEIHAIAFEAIDEEDRDAIVRHCLDVERKQIQIESGRHS